MSPWPCPCVHTSRQQLAQMSGTLQGKDRSRAICPLGSNYSKSQHFVVKEMYNDLQNHICHGSHRSWQIFRTHTHTQKKKLWKYLASKECGLILKLGLPLRYQWQGSSRERFFTGCVTFRVFLTVVFRRMWHWHLLTSSMRIWGENRRQR